MRSQGHQLTCLQAAKKLVEPVQGWSGGTSLPAGLRAHSGRDERMSHGGKREGRLGGGGFDSVDTKGTKVFFFNKIQKHHFRLKMQDP